MANVAAEVNYHGFLQPDDGVGISFWIISIAMVASTVFFGTEAQTVGSHWKTSLHVGMLVTLIAAVHYFYMREYWVQIHKWLIESESGSSTEAFETKRAAIAVSNDTDPETLDGATALSSSTDGDLLSAEKDLLELEATTALAAAAVAELGKRILRADLELAELEKLVSVNGGDAGTLDLALTKRKSEFEDYDNGEFKSATDDKAAAEAAIKARSGDKETVDG